MAFRTNKMPVLQEKSASGAVASFNTALAMPLVNGAFDIDYNANGVSGLNIYHRGINLWDEQWEAGGYDNTTGEKTTTANRIRSKNAIPIVENQTYYIKFDSSALVILRYDKNDNILTGVIAKTESGTFTISDDTRYIRFYLVADTYENNISINYPSTDTDYHSYNGNNYLVNFGQTIYGGYYNSATGILTSTKASDGTDLPTPIEIPLTTTQIETIGNNTIFADTGDIDLTYKDLDIAKRGNFREVFRLPS